MTKLSLTSKAETLSALEGQLRHGLVLPQFRLTRRDWADRQKEALTEFETRPWSSGSLIVRSSAIDEDTSTLSNAGHYLSVASVQIGDTLNNAVDRVFDSYSTRLNADEVFVQPMLQTASAIGVLFTVDQGSGAPYFVISLDPEGGSNTVTSGTSNDLKTYYHHHESDQSLGTPFDRLILLARELIEVFDEPHLDIEFGISENGEIYVFQVRRLIVRAKNVMTAPHHYQVIGNIIDTVSSTLAEHPFLLGKKSILGVMPDWNPAEIIGVRPRPLAFSLYRELVTDSIWSYQRNNYGYRNLRSFPLLKSLYGIPYVDFRISCNSFVPASLNEELGEKLVDYYIDRLARYPNLHDKVEFEIIFSCYYPDILDKMEHLEAVGLTKTDQRQIADCLLELTNNIIHPKTGLWRQDLGKLSILQERRSVILSSNDDHVAKIYWLLEDCKRYGTLPFAGLARAAFVAVQTLQSLVRCGVIDQSTATEFLNSLNTVSGQSAQDFNQLPQEAFLERYGHLRPGTYDILSPRYDEQPDLYFNWSMQSAGREGHATEFELTKQQRDDVNALLIRHNYSADAEELFDFMRNTIEARETAKFIFSHNLSDALKLLTQLGSELGLDKEALSYSNIRAVYEAYSTSAPVKDFLADTIGRGKEDYALTQQVLLPPLITSPKDVATFLMPSSEPNFVTPRAVTAPVKSHQDKGNLSGTIVMIPSADPGFDWIFSRGIAGFITAYGGVNSHMAIRAVELGLPAVIGAGEVLFAAWEKARILTIDGERKLVTIVQNNT